MRTTADVVVIGAGVLGTATAFELAERGLKVVVLERSVPFRGGSGTTAGNLHIQAIHTARPSQDVPVDNARLLSLQREASMLWDGVEERLGETVDVVRLGGLTVAETEAELAALHEKAVWERDAGIPTEVLDAQAAHDLLPALGPTVAGATWCAWDGYANALLATPAFLRRAAEHGTRLYSHAPVTALTRVGDEWLVETPAIDVTAPRVVIAAGPWIEPVSALAGTRIPLEPVAIQMHETVRAPRILEHLVQHVGRGLSVKQVRSGNIVIGGGWPAGTLREDGTADYDEASWAGNMADTARIVPPVADVTLARVWAGPLATTPDEMPLIGALPGAPGIFVEGGTYSFTFAPLWARTTAELVVDGTASIEVDDLGPARLLAGAPSSAPDISEVAHA